MTSAEEEPSPPEWLIRLEKKEKPHRLAHEIGAGSPCLKCGDKCPGLDLHFWRKTCRNCKCKKEDHDVIEDESYSHFNILFGSTQAKNIGNKPKKAVLDLRLKNGKEQKVPFDWTPPNITPELARAYMERLPQNKLPITNSDGALSRRQQLEKQIPLHDFDPRLCHELTPTEEKYLEEYAANVRNNIVGQGHVVRVPMVKGFTSNSTPVPCLKPFNIGKILNKNESNKRNEGISSLSQNFFSQSDKSNDRSLDNDPTLNQLNSNNDNGLRSDEGIGEDAKYHSVYVPTQIEQSDESIFLNPMYSKELKLKSQIGTSQNSLKGTFSTVRHPNMYLEHSEVLKGKNVCCMDPTKSTDFTSCAQPVNKINFPGNQNNVNYFKPDDRNAKELMKIDNLNYLVDSKDMYPEIQTPFSEDKSQLGSNKKDTNTSSHIPPVILKNAPPSYIYYSNELGNQDPRFTASLNTQKMDPSFSGSMPKLGSSFQREMKDERNQNTFFNPENNFYKGLKYPLSSLNLPQKNVEGINDSQHWILKRDALGNPESMQNAKEISEPISGLEEIQNEFDSVSLNEDIKCIQCETLIEIGSIAVVVQKKGKILAWHPECFVCTTCEELLVDLLYFYLKGKVYCGRDYAKICNIPRCYACDELIFMKTYTQAEGQSFHLRHFCCLECDVPLADKEYLPMNGHPICLPCYHQKYAKRCHKCGKVIEATQKTVRLNDLSWHADEICFSCFHCKKSLLNSKFTLKNEKPFCNQSCVSAYNSS